MAPLGFLFSIYHSVWVPALIHCASPHGAAWLPIRHTILYVGPCPYPMWVAAWHRLVSSSAYITQCGSLPLLNASRRMAPRRIQYIYITICPCPYPMRVATWRRGGIGFLFGIQYISITICHLPSSQAIRLTAPRRMFGYKLAIDPMPPNPSRSYLSRGWS
jgi:hypothetical protein